MQTISSDGVQIQVDAFEDHHLDRFYQSGVIGRVRYVRGTRGQITQSVISEQVQVPYVYDADLFLTNAGDMTISREPASGVMTGNQIGVVQETIERNSFGEIAETEVSVSDTPIFTTQFARDKLGRIVSKTETVQGQTMTHGYTYDLAGRLTDVSINGVPSTHYGYDANGNRIAENAVTASYDVQDRLTQYGDKTYAYTANGTLLQKTKGNEVTKYVYDEFGQLSKVTLPNGKVIEYLIDGETHRAIRKVDGVIVSKYLYHANGSLAAELNANNSVKWVFVYGSQSHSPDYMISADVKYKVVKDQLGSVRMLMNAADGSVVQRIDYDAFGKIVADTNPGLQPLGYAGGIYDVNTGLVRFGARDYDPEIGRWTTKDPILFAGGQENLYSYSMGDPINFFDPSGLRFIFLNAETKKLFNQMVAKITGPAKALVDSMCRDQNNEYLIELIPDQDLQAIADQNNLGPLEGLTTGRGNMRAPRIRISTDHANPQTLIHELAHASQLTSGKRGRLDESFPMLLEGFVFGE